MISVKRLKELLNQCPDDALVNAYEGEGCGIIITKNEKDWWIEAKSKGQDTFTQGFRESEYMNKDIPELKGQF